MLNEGTHIDLVTRLRTMSRVFDILVPESTSAALEEAVEAALEAVGRRELAEAIMLLEEGVQANPFWLRGCLFLATMNTRRKPSRPSRQSNKGWPCAPAVFVYSVPKDGARRWSGSTDRLRTDAFGII
jgi:hypothetical protein